MFWKHLNLNYLALLFVFILLFWLCVRVVVHGDDVVVVSCYPHSGLQLISHIRLCQQAVITS